MARMVPMNSAFPLLSPSNSESWYVRKKTMASFKAVMANILSPSFDNLEALNSTPIANSRSTAPISAKKSTVSVCATKPSACGPITAPMNSNPNTGGMRNRLAIIPPRLASSKSNPTSTKTVIRQSSGFSFVA